MLQLRTLLGLREVTGLLRTCSTCRQPFNPKFDRQRHCSTPCRDRMLGRQPRVRRGTTCERGLGYEHRKLKPIVLQRDGWTCLAPICLQPTRMIWRDAPPMHPMSGTAGHIVARSEGGTNHLSNYRAEHFGCNSSAGAKLGNRKRQMPYTSSVPRIAR